MTVRQVIMDLIDNVNPRDDVYLAIGDGKGCYNVKTIKFPGEDAIFIAKEKE